MDKLRVKDFPRLDSPKVNPHASNSLKHDPGRKNLLGSGVGGVVYFTMAGFESEERSGSTS